MDQIAFWGPKFLKTAGPYAITAGPSLYKGVKDTYRMVSDWADARGIKRKVSKFAVQQGPQQKRLNLPALPESSNNNLNMPRGRSMSRSSMRSMSIRRRSRSRSRPRRSMQTAGHYTGKLPFPYKRAKKDKSRVAYNGSQGTFEDTIGGATPVEGANVAYFGVSSIVKSTYSSSTRLYIANPVYHYVVGVLRKMFKKTYDVDIESVNQRIAELTVGTIPVGIRLYYKVTPLSSGTTAVPSIQSNTTHDVLFSTNTISDTAIGITGAILLNIEYGARNESFTGDQYELYGFAFLELGGGGTNAVFRGIYRVDNLKVSIRSTTTVYIQNQTTSDGGSASTDVIDSNPIKGRIYYFPDPNPICQFANINSTVEPWRQWKLMQDTNGDGLIYPDADPSINGTSVDSAPWAQLPGTDMFANCKKYSAVAMAPGEMRKINLTFKFYGYFNRFLAGLNLNNTYMGTGRHQISNKRNNNMGTSLLFAFDKRLSTGDGNVKLAVQRHITTSVKIGKRTMAAMQPVKYGEVAAVADDTTT